MLKKNLVLYQKSAHIEAENNPRLKKVQRELLVKKGQPKTLVEKFSHHEDELQKLDAS